MDIANSVILTVGTHDDGQGKTECNHLVIIVGGEGTDAPNGKFGYRCHC